VTLSSPTNHHAAHRETRYDCCAQLRREELDQLRREAGSFLAAVQELPGFRELLAELRPPATVLGWRWGAIVRVNTVPANATTGLPPGVLCRVGDSLQYEPRPDNDTLELIEAYSRRVERLARRFLAGVSWGPRAVHEAARTGASITLPHARLERHIRIFERAGHAPTISELEAILESHRAPRQLRGSRRVTWGGAVDAVRTRLVGEPVSTVNRRHLSNARRYLEAAVNRELPGPRQPVNPVEPTDHPLWEAHVARRIREFGDTASPPRSV
jgi:hypothetical protein